METKKFFKKHKSVLGFGLCQVFFSAPGQTFLISFFVTPVFQDLNLSLSYFAGIYSCATLTASFLLNPAGRLVDRYPLKFMIIGSVSLMSLGCFCLAFSQGLVSLFLGIFLLRLIGQGVFLVISSSTLGKLFFSNRAKAISIATLGYPLSELVFPTLALLLLSLIGWRMTYMVFGFSFLLLMLPIQLFLTRNIPKNKDVYLEGEGPEGHDEQIQHERSHTLSYAVKDPVFMTLILASCAPPILVTGLFFFQEPLFELHQWPIALASAAIAFYAVVKAFSSLISGWFVDKYGPIRPFFVLSLAIALGTFLSGWGGHQSMAFVYLGLMGFGLGMSPPVMNVIWPTLYGTRHLGSIRGFVGTFRNGLTALAPLPLATLIERGVSLTNCLIITSGFVLILAFIPLFVKRIDSRLN